MTNISQVIGKLYDNTKTGDFQWMSLQSYQSEEFNNSLRNYILKTQKNYYSFDWKRYTSSYLNEQNSYVLKTKNGGVFTLFSFEYNTTTYYILTAQKNPYGRVVELNVREEFQDKLYELSMLITDKCDSIEDFLCEFLCE